MRLFAYKMTDDTGFAPNPFWGCMTLATCKPQIRKCKGPGDWIAGFTSGKLCDDPVGRERLVFLMKVDEKIVLDDYYRDERFRSKIPRSSGAAIHQEGDNIYRPLIPDARNADHFEQLPNRNHTPHDKERDLSGQYALISEQFAYFGADAIRVPLDIRPDVPAARSGHGRQTRDQTRAKRFIEYVLGLPEAAVVHRPHQWPRTDSSWKTGNTHVPDSERPRIEMYVRNRSARELSSGTGSPRPRSSERSTGRTGCGRRPGKK